LLIWMVMLGYDNCQNLYEGCQSQVATLTLNQCIIFYSQFNIVGMPRPHHGNIIFLVTYDNLLVMVPCFASDPPLLMGQKQHPIDHETLSTWCHVKSSLIQISLIPQVLKVWCSMNLDCLWLLDQSHDFYITGQVPQGLV
jgi:hypothetical protein